MDPATPYRETLTLIERRDEGGTLSTYLFSSEHPVLFTAGQYAHVRLPSLPAGRGSVRELSFASAPSEPEIRFGVDGSSGSDFQQALRALRPGDRAELFKIRGHLTWPPPVRDVVMIAGGVGVTPFRSMVLDAHAQGLAILTTLIHVSRDVFLYAPELRGLVQEHFTIDRSLVTDTLTRVAAEHPYAHYYIAGSTGFVQAVEVFLRAHGLSAIESDEFTGLAEVS